MPLFLDMQKADFLIMWLILKDVNRMVLQLIVKHPLYPIHECISVLKVRKLVIFITITFQAP